MSTFESRGSTIIKTEYIIGSALNDSCLSFMKKIIFKIIDGDEIFLILCVLQGLSIIIEFFHRSCIKNFIPIRIEFLPCLVGLKTHLAVAEYIFIDVPQAQGMFTVRKNRFNSIDASNFTIDENNMRIWNAKLS